MTTKTGESAVLGGAVSGLAAAHALDRLDSIEGVTVFERQEYQSKRVNCGEAITDSTLVPLEKTPENGFVNDIEGFQVCVFSGDREGGEVPLGVSNLYCEPGYVCERSVVEREWAESLEERGVTFETGRSVTPGQYWDIVDRFDYVVDATGQPSLSLKARGSVHDYTDDMVALNATVEGDFTGYETWPRIFFEGYVGYAWSFPKSDSRANVGIGWAGDERPDDYMAALRSAAERNGFPVPERDQVQVYTIPRGPSLAPEKVYYPEDDVFLVGDAAGIANRYQGEGICQGIRSSYLLCDLIESGEERRYPERLYREMRSEYRLARLMRGIWVEFGDPHLLATVAESLDGLSIEEVTRSPARVMGRVVRRPAVAARLLASRGMRRRCIDAYTDNWEYSNRSRPTEQE